MPFRFSRFSFFKTLTIVCAIVLPMMSSTASAESSRMTTYTNADDAQRGSFALSVMADVETDPAMARHLAIIVDTSASQAGHHREESVAALLGLLNSLQSQDRVQLFAADLELVPLHDAPVAAKSSEIESALGRLRARAPLGATDIAGVFTSAGKELAAAPAHARRIVYIGDGMSKASLLESQDFQLVIDAFKADRVSVSSIAVGPRKDIAVLAALANHTGGSVAVASAEFSGQQLGSKIAKASRAAVAWPMSVEAPKTWIESFPASFPPIRNDRDSIVVGSFKMGDTPAKLTVKFDVDGTEVAQEWQLTAEPSNEDFAYLPKLIELARADNGVSMPTAGSPALREVRRVLMSGAHGLSSLAGSALASGDLNAAETLATAALEADPGNTDAEVIRNAIKRRKDQPRTKLMQFEGTTDEDGPLVLDAPSDVLDLPASPEGDAVVIQDEAVQPAQALQPIPNEVIIESQPIFQPQVIEYGPAPAVEFAPAPVAVSGRSRTASIGPNGIAQSRSSQWDCCQSRYHD